MTGLGELAELGQGDHFSFRDEAEGSSQGLRAKLTDGRHQPRTCEPKGQVSSKQRGMVKVALDVFVCLRRNAKTRQV